MWSSHPLRLPTLELPLCIVSTTHQDMEEQNQWTTHSCLDLWLVGSITCVKEVTLILNFRPMDPIMSTMTSNRAIKLSETGRGTTSQQRDSTSNSNSSSQPRDSTSNNNSSSSVCLNLILNLLPLRNLFLLWMNARSQNRNSQYKVQVMTRMWMWILS